MLPSRLEHFSFGDDQSQGIRWAENDDTFLVDHIRQFLRSVCFRKRFPLLERIGIDTKMQYWPEWYTRPSWNTDVRSAIEKLCLEARISSSIPQTQAHIKDKARVWSTSDDVPPSLTHEVELLAQLNHDQAPAKRDCFLGRVLCHYNDR